MSSDQKNHSAFPEVYNEQIKTLLECMSVCFACEKKCVEEGHKETAIACSECADICFLAAKALCCKSENQNQLLDICMQICKKCGIACGKMKVEHCQECSKVCTQCAENCTPSLNRR